MLAFLSLPGLHIELVPKALFQINQNLSMDKYDSGSFWFEHITDIYLVCLLNIRVCYKPDCHVTLIRKRKLNALTCFLAHRDTFVQFLDNCEKCTVW